MARPRMQQIMPMLALWVGLSWPGVTGNDTHGEAAAALTDHMVFVTEDRAIEVPGCDAVTAFGLRGPAHDSGDVLYRSAFQVSPGRLAGSAGFRVVTALSSNSSPNPPFLKILKQTALDPPTWEESSVSSERLVSLAGHAVLADDDTVLLPMQDLPVEPSGPRYSLEKYRLSEITSGRLGPARGVLPLDAPPIRVFVADGGRTLHVPTIAGTVVSADLATMTEIGRRIPIMPITVERPADLRARLARAHATLSADERYLATNTWGTGGIAVADLAARSARAMVLRPGKTVAGVEFSRAGPTRGLLAANLVDRVALFSMNSGATVREIARHDLPPIRHQLCFDYQTEFCSGPYATIAWGGDGSYLVAAGQEGESEFAVLNVHPVTFDLSPATWLTACDDPGWFDFPNDILTANQTTPPGMVPEPTDTALPSPTPSPSPTPDQTVTASASPTPTPTTPAPASTPTAAAPRWLAHLPFAQTPGDPPDELKRSHHAPPIRAIRVIRGHP